MLTPQQIEQYRAKYGIQSPQATQAPQTSGMSAAERIAALKAQPTQAAAQPTQNFFQDAGQDIQQTGEGLGRVYEETKKKLGEISDAGTSGEQGFGRSVLQSAGTIAGGISSGIGEVFKGAVKTALPQSWETGLKEGITTGVKSALPVAKSIDSAIGSPVQNAIKSYETASPTSKRDVDALLGAGSLALDVATMGLGKKAGETAVKKGVEVAGELGTKAVKTGEAVIKEAKPAIKSAAERIKELAYPSPTPMKAAGEVLGNFGKEGDIKNIIKAASIVDTTGVKTPLELGSKVKSKIKELAKQVDEDLSIDPRKRNLGDLNIIEKTKDGLDVITNPVKTALENLTEYYTKIGDNLKLAEVEAIVKKAVTEGIDNVDINNLAREYGRNFNAFNKMGDPLTSVTKQGYELTRSKLKDLARSGFSGDAAKAADEAISILYSVEPLIKKNIEAVSKLQRTIRERGLIEKVGHAVTKYADLLTGGSLRGMVAGIMPRGQGYKTLNALDLQDLLENNLKIIQKAIQTKSDDEVVKIINTLQKKVAPAKIVAPKKEPLLLNAPTKGMPRKSFGSGPVINLPKKTQTTVDKVANKQVLPKKQVEVMRDKSNPKNFKTAEEYVKAQQLPSEYRSAHQLSLSDSITADKIDIPTLKEQIRNRNGYLNNYNLSDLKKLEKLQNNPEAEVTIYRASPKNELNDGDWVTTDKTYANDIKKQNGGKVYSYTAKVSDLRFPKDAETLPSLSMASTFSYSPKTSQLIEEWNKAQKTTLPKPRTTPEIAKLDPANFKTAEEYVKAQQLQETSNWSRTQTKGLTDKGKEMQATWETDRLRLAEQSDKDYLLKKAGATDSEIKSGNINVYRATENGKLIDGDFVSPNKSVIEPYYNVRKDNGQNVKIVKDTVNIKDLLLGDEATDFVYAPNLKTKSQLISEWEKAQKIK